jgi:hypothetical protein
MNAQGFRWSPGMQVLTADDRRQWQQWRKDRKREQQRERRATNPRIDYYPDALAWTLITAMAGPRAGGDFSSVINRVVAEWAKHCHRNKVR